MDGEVEAFKEGPDVVLQRHQGAWIEAVAGTAALDGPLHEARLLQRLQVLGDGRLGQGQVVYNLTANALVTLGQEPHDGEPGWVGQCFQGIGKVAIRIREGTSRDGGHDGVASSIVYRRCTIREKRACSAPLQRRHCTTPKRSQSREDRNRSCVFADQCCTEPTAYFPDRFLPDSSSSSSPPNEDGRLVRTARAAAALAERLTTGVAVLAGVSAGAGLLLWGILWWPPSGHVSSLLGAAATFVPLLGPAAVLALFYQGLRDLSALPDRLSDRTTRTVEQSTDTFRSVTTETPPGLFGRLGGVSVVTDRNVSVDCSTVRVVRSDSRSGRAERSRRPW